MTEILNNYNQLLEELMKLFPEDTDTITGILIMDDDLKLQSIDIFVEMLNDPELYTTFLKRKIKVFSSKNTNTKEFSNSLFGSQLTLKNIFNNQSNEIKTTLWTYLQLIYITKLLENKDTNLKKIIELEVEIKKASLQSENVKENINTSKNTVKNPLDLDVNDDTNNMINDIISSFESKLGDGKTNPLESIMEITEMINGKYNDKINNGDIEIEKLLENVTGSVPGLDKMMDSLTKQNQEKEPVIIDENFSTDDVKMQEEESNMPDMAKMMGVFNKLTNMTNENGDLDLSAFMNQVSKDNNMTPEQTNQMEQMMNAIDNIDFNESV